MRPLRALGRTIAFSWTAFEAYLSFLALWASKRGRVEAKTRAEWLHRWCAKLLARLGINYQCDGTPPASGMIICNHVSYLDIFVMSAIVPCAFVAKKEIESWPLFGAFSYMAGTLFLDRERRSDTQRVGGKLEERLTSGTIVVLFPEGTSSDGTEVLPFRSSLFEPALSSGAQLTPAHVSYQAADAEVATEIAYWGEMKMLPHVMKLLGKAEIAATVRFGKSLLAAQDRKQTAIAMHEQVRQLGASKA